MQRMAHFQKSNIIQLYQIWYKTTRVLITFFSPSFILHKHQGKCIFFSYLSEQMANSKKCEVTLMNLE